MTADGALCKDIKDMCNIHKLYDNIWQNTFGKLITHILCGLFGEGGRARTEGT